MIGNGSSQASSASDARLCGSLVIPKTSPPAERISLTTPVLT